MRKNNNNKKQQLLKQFYFYPPLSSFVTTVIGNGRYLHSPKANAKERHYYNAITTNNEKPINLIVGGCCLGFGLIVRWGLSYSLVLLVVD